MQDEPVDAPELELTAEPSAGEDALQLGPSESPESAANLGDAFSIKHKKPKPEAVPPMKAAKAVTAQANDSVVAALMGLKLPSAKAQPAPRAEREPVHKPLATPISSAPQEDTKARDDFEPVIAEWAIAHDEPIEVDTPNRHTAAAADPTNESVEATIEAPAPTLRLVYPPLEDDSVIETESTTTTIEAIAPDIAPAAESDVVESMNNQADPLPSPLPEYRERGPEDAAPSTPKPRRAIPVAPQWPSEPPQAAPKRRTSPLPAPADIPTPPEHLVPPVRRPVAQDQTRSNPVAATAEPAGPTGAWWTIPLTFVGVAIVACSILVPASDENRRANYELAKIEQDVNYFERQSAVNKDFLERVNTDATLAERLALRQLHQTRQGVKIAPMSGKPDAFGASPFAMTRLDPPQPLPAYQPMNDVLTDWFLGEERSQQMAAIGLVVAGAGVMLGGRRQAV